jgi:hypothetical protein
MTRAKRLDNNKWIEGEYKFVHNTQFNTDHHYISNDKEVLIPVDGTTLIPEIRTMNADELKYPIGAYAPGHYQNRCANCKEFFIGDKLARQCELCALNGC